MNLVVVAIGCNYYFVWAATQVRPDIFAVALIAVALHLYGRWLERRSSGALLVAHVCLAASVFFHLQAAFLVAAFWIHSLLWAWRSERLKWSAFSMLPYLTLAAAYGTYVYPIRHEFASRVLQIFGGDMLGHAGGMLGALRRYLATGQAINGLRCWLPHRGARLWVGTLPREGQDEQGLVAATGGYGWDVLMATDHLLPGYLSCGLVDLSGDSHSAGSAQGHRGKEARASPESLLVRAVATAGLLLLVGLTGLGLASGARLWMDQPGRAYYAELGSFTNRYNLRSEGVSGVRDIMWYFRFDRSVLCLDGRDRRFFIGYANGEDRMILKGRTFRRIETGKLFSLYERTGP